MPFNRPTLTDHRNTIIQDMQSAKLPGVTNITRFSVLGIFAKTWAGMAYLHDSFLDWIARQGVPWTATDEQLEGWANLKGITRKPATAASGMVCFQATAGSILPAGTSLSMRDLGTATTTRAATADATGQVTAPAIMTTSGAVGNIPLDTTVSLTSPILGIQSNGNVASAFTGGADIESVDDFRGRMLTAYQTGGKNGNARDYTDWALAVPGVTRAWVTPNGFGVGSVVLYVMFDKTNTAQQGFPVGNNGSATEETRYHPATGDQLAVANAVYPLRPVTALVIVCAPIAQLVDFTITNLGENITADTKTAIITALNDLFRRISAPGESLYPSTWNAALDALNLPHYSVQSPASPITADSSGHMPVLGHVFFRS